MATGHREALLAAWLVGEGIITYRTVARQHRPPMPGELLASSGAFVLLALLAEWQAGLAVTIAVGLDIAAFLNLAGSGTLGKALSGPSSVVTPAPLTPVTVPPSASPPPLPLPQASPPGSVLPPLI